jgi:ABC-2 type transport system ATP-binding protein
MVMSLLTAENICKTFTRHVALDDVSLSIPEGSIYGILGPNGAGKTTFLRIITQILAPDSGSIRFMDRPLVRSDIKFFGYLPEERGLYKRMKVGEHAMYLAQLKGMKKREAREKLTYWFEKYEILSWWNRRIEELSKGMQQKVQFIVTVLHEPKVIIFDEPFSGFDPININMLMQDIMEMKKKGSTIIFATHNMSSVEELCDHITLLNNSRNVLTGEVHDIRKRYRENLFHVEFEGDANNLYSALKVPFQVESLESKQGIHIARIRFNQPVKENDILSMLISKVVVLSFHEVLPGMIDVFIKTVKDSIFK